jgi:hypothetical protein
MNEELSAGENRLLFYFFILHSYFFICFWSPPCRPEAPSGSPQSATVFRRAGFHLLSTKTDHLPHPLEI